MKNMNDLDGTIGKVLVKNQKLLDSMYNMKVDLIATLENIFEDENIINNAYAISLLANMKKKTYDQQFLYLYNIIAAGYNLKVI